ncbi:MAG: hypothetical protein ACRD40_06815 [Candidatus Acidiferrales bacterium]
MHTSGPQGGALVALFILLFVFCWIVTGMLVSRMTGWHRLAERFSLDGEFPAERWRFKSATARYGSNYNNCLTIAANPMGLYMAMLPPFLIGHPALLIPWNEISISRKKVLFWNVVQFQIGRETPVTFGFREDFAQQIRRAAGASWPGDGFR